MSDHPEPITEPDPERLPMDYEVEHPDDREPDNEGGEGGYPEWDGPLADEMEEK